MSIIETNQRKKKSNLSKNLNTSVATLQELAKDDYWVIRYNVADNPNSSKDILRDLSLDKDIGVRLNVASNPNTPVNILRNLAKDSNYAVRCNVANNLTASSNILVTILEYERSFKNPHKDTITRLYTNKKLPCVAKKIIETLYGEML